MNEIEMLRNESLPVFIWGVETSAHHIKDELACEGIEINGFATDRLGNQEDGEVWNRDSIIKQYSEYAIIRGFVDCFYMTDEEIMKQWPGCTKVYTISEYTDRNIVDRISKEYYEEHRADFNRVRDGLADELSINSLDAYIKTRVEQNYRYLLPYIVSPQYFFTPSLWTYSGDDVLVDGGGYIGDSILDFVHLRGNDYRKIITLEPDEANYHKLLETVKNNHIERVLAVNKGLYRETTTLKFDPRGTGASAITDIGKYEIDVCSIDELAANEPVSIIKMDIEGSEMNALYGARKTISTNRPILMISAYHKRGDVFNIYDFVNETVENYRFYFRIHKPVAFDDVLYAVPDERVIK